MRGAVLIVGSLFWGDSPRRRNWRSSRLLMERAVHVFAPIRYGRTSGKRGNTFSMTLDAGRSTGHGILVPCRANLSSFDALAEEAKALWRAESTRKNPQTMGEDWGCVGVSFRDRLATSSLARAWAEFFQREGGRPIAPVDSNGQLMIGWPTTELGEHADVDLILATATDPDALSPNANEIADRWIEKSGGYEGYFFENVRHGIRTEDDHKIWRRMESRRPPWITDNCYAASVALLRDEERQ